MYKRIQSIQIPLFIILPVAGFVLSLFNFRSRSSAIIYIIFAMMFGYSISFSDTSADSFRYAVAFSNFDNTLDYNKIVSLYQDGELRDIYRLLLFYFTALFTNNPKVMYAFAGFVYGSLSYASIKLLIQERGQGWDRYVLILSVIFFTYTSISGINGFRFNTGALLLFYATYQMVIKKKLLWVIGLVATPFVHYGFMLVAPLILIYFFVGKRFYNKAGVHSLLYIIFIFTFIASWFLGTNSINIGFLTQSDALSGAVGSRLEYMNSEEITTLVENRAESSAFISFQTNFAYAVKIYVFIVILFLRKLIGKFKGDKTKFSRLFAFVLFFYSVGFIAASFPSGGRFISVAHLFLIVLLSMVYSVYKEKDIRQIILFAVPVFSFHVLFLNFMLPYLILTPSFWYGNAFWIIMEGLNFYIL